MDLLNQMQSCHQGSHTTKDEALGQSRQTSSNLQRQSEFNAVSGSEFRGNVLGEAEIFEPFRILHAMWLSIATFPLFYMFQ